jgi:hypothetical protein
VALDSVNFVQRCTGVLCFSSCLSSLCSLRGLSGWLLGCSFLSPTTSSSCSFAKIHLASPVTLLRSSKGNVNERRVAWKPTLKVRRIYSCQSISEEDYDSVYGRPRRSFWRRQLNRKPMYRPYKYLHKELVNEYRRGYSISRRQSPSVHLRRRRRRRQEEEEADPGGAEERIS